MHEYKQLIKELRNLKQSELSQKAANAIETLAGLVDIEPEVDIPERVWVWAYEDTDRDNYPTFERVWDDSKPDDAWLSDIRMPPTEYVRSDLFESTQIKSENMKSQLNTILQTIRDDVHLTMTGKTSLLGKIERSVEFAIETLNSATL